LISLQMKVTWGDAFPWCRPFYSASIHSKEYTGSQEQHTGEHVENPPFFHRVAGCQ
jgi:hypothetical protein